jgi:hypothetical protein
LSLTVNRDEQPGQMTGIGMGVWRGGGPVAGVSRRQRWGRTDRRLGQCPAADGERQAVRGSQRLH